MAIFKSKYTGEEIEERLDHATNVVSVVTNVPKHEEAVRLNTMEISKFNSPLGQEFYIAYPEFNQKLGYVNNIRFDGVDYEFVRPSFLHIVTCMMVKGNSNLICRIKFISDDANSAEIWRQIPAPLVISLEVFDDNLNIISIKKYTINSNDLTLTYIELAGSALMQRENTFTVETIIDKVYSLDGSPM